MDSNGDSWSKGLKFVIHTINTSVSRITSKSPYEVVFGQTPRSDFHILKNLAAQGIIYEEDIPEDIPMPDDGDNIDGISVVPSTSSDAGSEFTISDVEIIETQDDLESDVGASAGPDLTTDVTQVQPQKRGREYFLMKEDSIIASGHEIPGQDMLNGVDVNIETHAILKIDEIHENHQTEFEENDLVSSDRNHLVDSGEGNPSHKAVRLEAQKCYLKAAATQRTRHRLQMDEFVKDYAIGDTVGIKIHNADRTNTDARLLPCKVYEVTIKNDIKCYRIYSATGKLKNTFTGEELVDMKNVVFPVLATVDPSSLEEVSIVQASRGATNWQSSKKGHDVCQCKGSCITNRCCCKKKGIKCSTKCRVSSMSCQNKI